MAQLVRVAALTGYFETARQLAIDPLPLLREVGLSRDLLANPEQMISARAAARLLERSAESSGCQTFGLRMAESRALADLGATSLLFAHQPTLRRVLESLVEFRNRLNSNLVMQVEIHGDRAILREDFALDSPEPTRQATDLALGVLARLCATVLGEQWAPQAICFTHQPPPRAEFAIYSRLFRCRPEFDSEVNGIVIAASDLDRANPRADSALAGHARHLIETTMAPALPTRAQDVEQAIMLLLPAGRASIQVCAESLGVTVRTLQRQLDAEQTAFSVLLNRARGQLAAQYLANPRLQVTEVAQLLGYGSIGAFTRWHIQQRGLPPLKWRRQVLAGLQRGK